MREDDDHDELVAALQDVMLPPGIPVLPGVDLAARYCLPGGAEEAVGNWFDVITLDDGRIGLIVGEAVGTGIAAAAAMGQVRAVLRAGLQFHQDVVAALELADTFARTSDDARGIGIVVALVDPSAESVTYATAGHPAPIITDSDESRCLDRSGAGWLGTGSTFTSTEAVLSRGDLVLLTCAAPHRTSGSMTSVVDRERLPGNTDATCDRLISALVGLGNGDALTLLVAELRLEPRSAFSLDLPAGEWAKRTGRERLSEWLREIDAPHMDTMAIVHASGELITNAVEHAHGGRHTSASTEIATMAQVHIRAELTTDGQVRVEVSDHGTWREPADDDLSRGRGLAMAAGLVDSMQVTTGETGTQAVITQRLCRPVHLDRGPRIPASLPVRAVEVLSPEPGAVALLGDFGHDDVDRVTAELLLASRGGTRPLRVDLGQVTHLANTAVRMLADLIAAHGATSIALSAPLDSAAHRALDVACVPHDAA